MHKTTLSNAYNIDLQELHKGTQTCTDVYTKMRINNVVVVDHVMPLCELGPSPHTPLIDHDTLVTIYVM